MLLDSAVIIDYLMGLEPARTALRDRFITGRLQTTVINQFELLSGSRQTEPQLQAVTSLLSVLKIVALDPESALAAAEIRRDLVAAGNDIGMADCLIAGIAVAKGLRLLTRNRRHFERVPRLQLVDLIL